MNVQDFSCMLPQLALIFHVVKMLLLDLRENRKKNPDGNIGNIELGPDKKGYFFAILKDHMLGTVD